MLAALNTGHDGGMTTLHANTAADVVPRLAALAGPAGLSGAALAAQVDAALDVVVHLVRTPAAATPPGTPRATGPPGAAPPGALPRATGPPGAAPPGAVPPGAARPAVAPAGRRVAEVAVLSSSGAQAALVHDGAVTTAGPALGRLAALVAARGTPVPEAP